MSVNTFSKRTLSQSEHSLKAKDLSEIDPSWIDFSIVRMLWPGPRVNSRLWTFENVRSQTIISQKNTKFGVKRIQFSTTNSLVWRTKIITGLNLYLRRTNYLVKNELWTIHCILKQQGCQSQIFEVTVTYLSLALKLFLVNYFITNTSERWTVVRTRYFTVMTSAIANYMQNSRQNYYAVVLIFSNTPPEWRSLCEGGGA